MLPKNFRFKKIVTTLAACVVVLMLCQAAFSQGNLGRLMGVVTDQTGGVIAGANVTVVDVQRGVSRTLVTDDSGEYSAPSLIPGQYELRVEAMGFNKFNRQNITIEVGQEVRVDASLTPGSQTQTVTVTESVPDITTTNATLGGVIENQALTELPLSGRNYLHLLDDKPGVQMKPGGGPNSYTSNGQRNAANGYMVDGLFSGNVNTGASAVLGGGSGAGGPEQANVLPVDGIQEINVMQDPKAEYGPRPGAYINIGMKSGTNSLHGTAYGFGRDQSLEARNAFLTTKQPTTVEQWGASLGGPIKKDRVFFFTNFEKQNFSIAAAKTANVPTTAVGAGVGGSFPDAIAAMNLAHVPVSQLSLNLAGCSNTGTPASAALISCDASKGIFGNSQATTSPVLAFPVIGGSNNVIAKIDYSLNDKNAIHGEYVYGDGKPIGQSGIRVQPYWRGPYHIRSQVVRAAWVWTPNSAWVNEARFGYDRLLQNAQPGDCFPQQFGSPDYASLGFVSGVAQCGLGTISFGSTFTALGSGLGSSSLPAYFQGEDAVSRTLGKHVFKFGAGIRSYDWNGGSYSGLSGTIAFANATVGVVALTPLQAFLNGTPNTSSTANSILVGNPNENLTWKSYWGFVQDDWRITPKITLNLGLRYDYEGPQREAHNNAGGFDPTAATGLFQQSSSRSLWNPSKKDFAPRVGIAWDVTGKATTVVRAGGGVFYEPFVTQISTSQETAWATPTGATLALANGTKIAGPGTLQNGTVSGTSLATLIQSNWAVNTPIFGTIPTTATLSCGNGLGSVNPLLPTNPATNPANPAVCNLGVVDPGLKMAIVGEWNFGIQHAITNTITLDVSYVGNHGAWGTGALDPNQPTPGAKANEQLRRPYYSQFPYLGQISTEFSADRSNYNSLQASLRKRISSGLSLTAGYTYGHALDIHSLDGTANPKGVMDSTHPQLDYGSGDYDYRQRFTMTGTYLIPGKKTPAQILEGWQLNSTLNILSGVPVGAFDTTSDLSGTGEQDDRWSVVGNPRDFTEGTTATLPCWGVAGSSFSTQKDALGNPICTVVSAGGGSAAAKVANMPAACVNAAAGLPTNPNVADTGLASNATGLEVLGNFGCYMTGSTVIVPPAQGTFGNMARNVLRGQRLRVWDVSLAKNWKIKERFTAQFRVECFNVINAVNYAANGGTNPATPSTFGVSPGTPDVVNSAPVFGTGGPRKIQLGAKLIF
jgi:outer membrane receptor protein involved in Fe transport